MKVIKDKKQFPKWFTKEAYSCFDDLTNYELVIHLLNRIEFISYLENLEAKYSLKILGENLNALTDDEKFDISIFTDSWQIPERYRGDLPYFFIQEYTDENNFSKQTPAIFNNICEDTEGEIDIEMYINLTDYSDDEILFQFRKCLAIARKDTGAFQPKRKKLTDHQYKKLRTYKPI